MPKEIPLTKDKVALVDDGDFDWLTQWHWYCSGGKYAARRDYTKPGRPLVYMHRQVMGLEARQGRAVQVDHGNHDTLDNRRSNLRVCSGSQNCRNQQPKGGVSRFIGVASRWDINRFRSYISFEGRQFHLGYYQNAEEAARVRDGVAFGLFAEFANLNFPDEIQASLKRPEVGYAMKRIGVPCLLTGGAS